MLFHFTVQEETEVDRCTDAFGGGASPRGGSSVGTDHGEQTTGSEAPVRRLEPRMAGATQGTHREVREGDGQEEQKDERLGEKGLQFSYFFHRKLVV